MMKSLTYCISFIIFLFVFVDKAFCDDFDKSYSTGLIFKSHEVNKDERTSLCLTPDGPLKLPSNYTLEFDLKLNSGSHTYGHIFRIVANDTISLDMTSDLSLQRMNVILNGIKGAKAISEFPYDMDRIENKWVRVVVEIGKDSIKYSVGGKTRIINRSFTDVNKWEIFFGANKHKRFYTFDISPMSIKNIIIKDEKGNYLRNWRMSKHNGDIVYDSVGNYPASVINSAWELDKHATWKSEILLNTKDQKPQIAYDSIKVRVFAATQDSLYIIDIKNKKIERFKVEGGKPYLGAPSQLIYDYEHDQLISYKIDQPNLLKYSFKTNKWSGSLPDLPVRIQHNNRFIDKEMNRLVVFGGYGLYRYKAMLSTHGLSADNWEHTNLMDQLSPRYLASMGYLGDGKILIFGGYGSVSGIQEEYSWNLYDLHEIDTRNKSSVKLGELEELDTHLTFGNSMVVNKKEQKFYTLSYRNDKYKTAINLFEVDMKTMKYQLLADSIPYNFYDTESFCDLFLHKGSDLYSIVSQKQDDNTYSIHVYSLKYPPLAQADVVQVRVEEGSVNWFILILIILVSLLGYLVGYHLVRKQKKRNAHSETDDEIAPDPIVLEPAPVASPTQIYQPNKTASYISLLGGFQVFDSKGEDITSSFSPILRQIFLMILLESITTGKGVTSAFLDETIWFDMDKPKASNNRNVNMSKLRLLLQEVGNITLKKNGNYWQINFEEDVFCDYESVMNILVAIKDMNDINKIDIEKVINIASSGILLPNIETEWADRYKSDYSSLLIEVLMEYAAQKDAQQDSRLLIKLADTILLHDNIDEYSIQLKCNSLYKLGQKGLSKQCYDKFCGDYKNILNEDPILKYEDIIAL